MAADERLSLCSLPKAMSLAAAAAAPFRVGASAAPRVREWIDAAGAAVGDGGWPLYPSALGGGGASSSHASAAEQAFDAQRACGVRVS